MATEEKAAGIRVEVAYAAPEKQVLLELIVPVGCTIGEAIDLSGIKGEFPEMELNPQAVGIFSRKASIGQTLENGDRVEIYRPLIADPKELRKQRARSSRGK